MPTPEQVDGVFMARGTHSLREPGMAALLRGQLTVRDGCLVVVDSGWFGNDPVLVVWAREYSLRRDGDRLRVFEGDRAVVAVGDLVEIVGGEAPADLIARVMSSQIPTDCRAPKYYVGNVTKRV
ncbi:MAG TPA: hypothetical protein VFQ66_04465 [Candidatus Limnocylindria bacterium]|nr:hypothetical protein [Candidatus Limnocylindria bacterium]